MDGELKRAVLRFHRQGSVWRIHVRTPH
jgi:hypothetical protein